MFITAVVLLSFALLAFLLSVFLRVTKERRTEDRRFEVVADKGPNKVFRLVSVGFILVGLLFMVLASFYRQDPGEANVLRSWTGEIVGYETTEGLHWKAPWVDNVTFDIRNQRVVYTGGASEGDNSGGAADGAQITVQDGDGVTANIDIAIRYSIKPDAVEDIYKQYLNEENLRSRLIFNDIRSVVRSVPGDFTTLELLTNRNEVQAAIQKALEARWEDDGIIVDDVALQEIRYPDTVQQAFAAAQEARTAVETAKANLEKAEVDAQQKVVNAQAEADANSILNASLTVEILQQRYLDTLKELAAGGNLVVVPEGFNGLVNVGK